MSSVVVRVQRGEGASIEYRTDRLPIIVGRDPESDLEIPSRYVSGRHLRIDADGKDLYICDLGSTNGTHVEEVGGARRRLARQQPYPLARCDGQFFLGDHLRVIVESEDGAARRAAQESSAGPSAHAVSVPPAPASRLPSLGLPSLPRSPGAARRAAAPAGAFGVPAASFDPPEIEPFEVAGPPEMREPPERALAYDAGRGDGALHTQHFHLSREALALRGLSELSSALVPQRALDTQGDIARLITRLHDTVEASCRAYVSARRGYRKFVSRMGLERSRAQSSGRAALDTSDDAAAVAAALLDFGDASGVEPADLEAGFEELSVHQVALLEGVMRGVEALLEELSPRALEAQTPASRGGLSMGGKDKRLWQAYCRRHAELSDEGDALSTIFGEEFNDAYRAYRRRRA